MSKFDPKNGRYDEAEARYLEMASAGHYDASYSAILARNLQYIRSQVWEVQKAPLHAFEVFPVMTDVPAGAETAIQRIYDTMGIAKIVSNYADDLPRADVVAKEESVKVVTIGDSYGYNVRELDNAAFANTNLTEWRARAARRAIDVKLNKLAWFGDTTHNIRGFLNHDNITQVAVAADGNVNGGINSKKFKHKTSEQIIRDINDLLNAIDVATNNVEFPDTVLLPTEAYDLMVMTPRNSYSDKTILAFLRDVHPEIRWMKIGELDHAGVDGESLMVAGRFTPDVVRFEIPERLRQLPIEKRNLEYVVDCLCYAIGVTIFVPLAFSKASGI